ncbi:MAG: nitroreductase, partial [Flavobacteriales bacterium]
DRRSVSPERFSTRKVHREQIELVLTNATWAPSHGLTQPWRFRVFLQEGMEQLAVHIPRIYKEATSPEAFRQAKFEKLEARFRHISAAVIVCLERDPSGKIAEIEEVEAVACAVQNMYLTCTAYGMAGFWSSPGFIYSRQMHDWLGLGPADKCLGIFYIGYPEGEWPRSHRKPLEYVTQWITG